VAVAMLRGITLKNEMVLLSIIKPGIRALNVPEVRIRLGAGKHLICLTSFITECTLNLSSESVSLQSDEYELRTATGFFPTISRKFALKFGLPDVSSRRD
jgi:hypothetical protein